MTSYLIKICIKEGRNSMLEVLKMLKKRCLTMSLPFAIMCHFHFRKVIIFNCHKVDHRFQLLMLIFLLGRNKQHSRIE